MRKNMVMLFALISALCIFICSCTSSPPEEQMPVDADLSCSCVVFYESQGCLVPVNVKTVWSENTLDELYAQLCAAPAELDGTGLNAILPADTLIETSVEDKIASVHISAPSIDSLTANQARNIATAAVNTATQFDGIEGVSLVFNGSSEKLGGVDISKVMCAQCINPAYDIGDLTPFEVYYQLGDGDYVVPVTKAARKLSADVAVKAMMKAPEGKDVKPLFPDGTELLSAELDGGVLTLNFSSEFSKIEESPEKQKQLLGSLVSMLKQLEGVNDIQILVEGVPFNYNAPTTAGVFANTLDFKDPADTDQKTDEADKKDIL